MQQQLRKRQKKKKEKESTTLIYDNDCATKQKTVIIDICIICPLESIGPGKQIKYQQTKYIEFGGERRRLRMHCWLWGGFYVFVCVGEVSG